MLTPINSLYSDVYNRLLNPLLEEILPALQQTRDCPKLSDRDWLACGICRVIDNVASGRDFLQRYEAQVAALPDVCPERGHFFESLKSKRRLALCAEASAALARRMQSDAALAREDRLQIFGDLDGFEIFAGDGHFHSAAAHDPAVDATKYAVGHLYTLNLRTHALSHLCVADQANRKKEHDMRALKRQDIDTLRQGTPSGNALPGI